jgi:fructose-bisphosphate aldolase class II
MMYGRIASDEIALLFKVVKQGVMQVVGSLIVEFGCVGKADLVQSVSLE